MPKTPPAPPMPPVIENATAPMFFVDELAGAAIIQGCLRLTFVTLQNDHSPNPAPAVGKFQTTVRLVMPLEAAKRAMEFMDKQIKALEAGIAPQPDTGRIVN
jgi:hypothetical protein